jgi:hypothetical protein
VEGAGDAEAVRVEGGAVGRLGHQAADGPVSQDEPVHFLDDLAGMAAAEVGLGASVDLVDRELVQGGFDRPALVVLQGQASGRGLPWVEQRGDQTGARVGPGAGRVVDGVLDHADEEPSTLVRAGGCRGGAGRQERAVRAQFLGLATHGGA